MSNWDHVYIPMSIIGFHWLTFHRDSPTVLISGWWLSLQTKAHPHSNPKQSRTLQEGAWVAAIFLEEKYLAVAIKIQNACAFWPGSHTLRTITYRCTCRNTKGSNMRGSLQQSHLKREIQEGLESPMIEMCLTKSSSMENSAALVSTYSHWSWGKNKQIRKQAPGRNAYYGPFCFLFVPGKIELTQNLVCAYMFVWTRGKCRKAHKTIGGGDWF